MKFSFNLEDASQVFVGAFALAVPISFSEEAWRLGETLPFHNLIMLFVLSLLFLTLFTYQSVFQKDVKSRLFGKRLMKCIFSDPVNYEILLGPAS